MDQPDPIDWHLDNWRTWMHAPALDLGVKIGGGIYTGANNTSFDEMCEAMDLRLAEATGAVIDHELTPAQQCAIHHRYLFAVYRFPRNNYPHVLSDAREVIRMSLFNKGILIE